MENHDVGNLIYGDDIVWFIKSRRVGTIIRIGQLRIPPQNFRMETVGRRSSGGSKKRSIEGVQENSRIVEIRSGNSAMKG